MSFLFRDDAGREQHSPPHNVFRRVRAERHADGNVVGDVADDATNQWSEDAGRGDLQPVNSNNSNPSPRFLLRITIDS